MSTWLLNVSMDEYYWLLLIRKMLIEYFHMPILLYVVGLLAYFEILYGHPTHSYDWKQKYEEVGLRMNEWIWTEYKTERRWFARLEWYEEI